MVLNLHCLGLLGNDLTGKGIDGLVGIVSIVVAQHLHDRHVAVVAERRCGEVRGEYPCWDEKAHDQHEHYPRSGRNGLSNNGITLHKSSLRGSCQFRFD